MDRNRTSKTGECRQFVVHDKVLDGDTDFSICRLLSSRLSSITPAVQSCPDFGHGRATSSHFLCNVTSVCD